MLYHIGVWPDFLVGITWQACIAINEEMVGIGKIVGACNPTGAMAAGTANLTEEFAAALHRGIAQVAGGSTANPLCHTMKLV